MRRTAPLLLCLLFAGLAGAQDAQPLRVIMFGGHPDDCDIKAGGTAARYAAAGHKVKYVAVTNGDAGHQSQGGGALARRRMGEARESARRAASFASPWRRLASAPPPVVWWPASPLVTATNFTWCPAAA